MRLTDFEESTGTNLWPPRPITNMSAWPDPEQAAIARRAEAHSCPLRTQDKHFYLLEPKGVQHNGTEMALQVSTISQVTGPRPALSELLTGL